MNNCIGIINLDEMNKTMELTRHVMLPLASLPIVRYRVIDFILSNMTNSGVEAIGIFKKINQDH